MPKPRTGFILALITTILFAILAVPEFSVDIGSYKFHWPALDLSIFNIQANIGNMQKGVGVYADHVVTYTTSTILQGRELNLISDRQYASGLDELDIKVRRSTAGSEISIAAPNYFTAARLEAVAQVLLSQGKVQIWQHDSSLSEKKKDELLSKQFGDYRPKASTLLNRHILQSVYAARTSFGGSYLEVKLNEEGEKIFQQLQPKNLQSASDTKPLIIAIDGKPKLYMLNLGATDIEIAAFKIESATTNDELHLMSTYLGKTQHLPTGIAYDSTQVLPAQYSGEGTRWIEIVMLAIVVVIILRNYVRYGFAAGFSYDLALFAQVVVLIMLLKLGALSISVATLIAVGLTIFLSAWWLEECLQTDWLNVKPQLRVYRNTALALFIIVTAALFSGALYGVYAVFASVFALGMISISLSAWALWPHLLRYYFDRK